MKVSTVRINDDVKSEFKLPKGVTVNNNGELVDGRPWYQRLVRDSISTLKYKIDKEVDLARASRY